MFVRDDDDDDLGWNLCLELNREEWNSDESKPADVAIWGIQWRAFSSSVRAVPAMRHRQLTADFKWLTLVKTPASSKIDKVVLSCWDRVRVLQIPVGRAGNCVISHLLRMQRDEEDEKR